jgi:hypothetical protein
MLIREMRIRFTRRQRMAYDPTANLAPEQQRRVVEYGSGESEQQPSRDRTRASGWASESSSTWIDRALDGLEPLVD